MIEPIVVDVTTKKSPHEAFQFFVEQMHKFWPLAHSIGDNPRTGLVMELKEGGSWYEVCGEQRCEWGRVLSFVLGKSISLAWHLDAEWNFDPDTYTELLLTFEPSGDGCAVRLTHSELDRYGETAQTVRSDLSAPTGWPDIMGSFAQVA
ncbi:SRPBCC domain-containing protein [Maritalea sp.]|uniref:SRPBCC domain-containing protein n=1 Tax=Maritalea sp. TaxID=2003361 RepID=UPI003EF19DBF